jgi:probable HAF family extracellular repeat protein
MALVEPQSAVASVFSAQVTIAPDDGATVSGTVTLEVTGSNIANVELLPADGYLPRYAVFTVSDDKTSATAKLDTTKFPDGALVARISAFDTPAGSSTATEIIAMPARTWNIQNGAKPSPGTFSAQLSAAPADGATISGTVVIEVTGSNIQNVELLPSQGYVPILATFTVSADRTRATLVLDTTTLSDGAMAVRISAFDAPAGMPANEIVAMPARTWVIKNKAVPATFSAQVTVAPADGATISGKVHLEVTGTGIENVELLPSMGYVPIFATFSVSADKTKATLDFDTTRLSNGTLAVRISAFDVPARTPGASEIVAMATRSWNIRNTAWSIVDLGALGGAASTAAHINDAGDVVGYSNIGSGSEHAFLYRSSAMIDLGTLGGAYSHANAINNAGRIIGYSALADGSTVPFLYQGGAMAEIGALTSTSSRSAVYDINDGGDIVATEDYKPYLYTRDGVLASLGYLRNFSYVWGLLINNTGQIAITDGLGKYVSAYLFTGSSLVKLALPTTYPFPYHYAYGMNNLGDVVGVSSGHAFLYSKGTIYDLSAQLGVEYSCATGINDSGLIVGVGNYPFLYKNGAIIDLNSLAEVKAAGWKLDEIIGINSSGQIAGTGVNKAGQRRAFVLTPPAAP